MDSHENSSKKIEIGGQNNRYNIRKACKIKLNEKKTKTHPDVIHHKQRSCINQIYIGEDCENSIIYQTEIKKKINGYKQQDRKKGVLDEEKFIKYEECLEKIMISKLSCHYCKCNLQILYNSTLEKKQWSLDRIDNDIGHNVDNVVISCLECNIQRRRTDIKKFEFTKSLKILKKGY